jgi:hypothetical protein
VRLSPLGNAATTGLLYQPQMTDDGDCGATAGMKIGRGNRSTWRKPALMPLRPPQIPHDLTRARTRAAAVGSQQLTAWAMTRPGAVFICSQQNGSIHNLYHRRKYEYVSCNMTKMCICSSIFTAFYSGRYVDSWLLWVSALTDSHCSENFLPFKYSIVW